MHPLSDKDLDRLSREAAEQYDVEQNTSGWDRLEQKLNKHLPEKGRKERRRFLFFIWSFALLSGAGLFWILAGSHSSQYITLKEGSTGIVKPLEKIDPSETNTKDNSQKAAQDKKADLKIVDPPAVVSKDESPKIQETDTKTVENTAGSSDRVIDSHETRLSDKKSGLEKTRKEKTVVKNSKIKGNKLNVPVAGSFSRKSPTDDKQVNEDKKKTTGSDESKTQPKVSSPTPDQPVAVDNEPATDNSKTKSVEEIKPEQLKPAPDTNIIAKKSSAAKKKPGFKKGFEIGLVAAPDMSTVKFTNTDKVGYNVGLQLGYRFSQRWSVNTGVVYTRKNYTSQGKDFNPPKGSWLDNVKLDMVTGNCFMFDIPLNVRYDLNNSDKHRFFVSTGLSTYLMKKEEYHYHYQYPNGSPGYRYRSFPSSENHFLSILNVSAGFEKKVSNRLSVQAEPYFKIPLAGVGYGNLKLNSYGMNFLLKFHAGRR